MIASTSPVAAVTGTHEGPADGPLPRFARWPVAAVAAVVGVAHLVAAAAPARWFDEALMLAIGRRHLDWGSADQPPVAPLLARLADTVAPGSQLALAVPAVLATVGAVVLAALIARELGGDARAQTLTALAQATGLWVALGGHWLTPYTLEPVQWLAIGWLLVRWVRIRDDRLLLALGLVAGVAAQTKFQVLLLCAVLLLAVLAVGPRDLPARPRLWIGVAIAALIAAPTLVWQALHGWPQLAMGPIVTAEADALYGGRPGVAVSLLATAGLMGLVLMLYGLVRALRSPQYRFLAVTFLVLFVVFALTPGRPYYLVGLHGVLAAFGAVGLQRRREAGATRWRWVAWPAAALSAAIAAAALAASVPTASPVVADAVAATTARAYRALPPAERDRTVLMGESYIHACYLDSADPALGLPPAHSGNRSYGYFDLPSEDRDTVLYVGKDPGPLRPFFAGARVVERIDPGPVEGLDGSSTTAQVWLLEGRHAPWTEIGPAVRSLTVS